GRGGWGRGGWAAGGPWHDGPMIGKLSGRVDYVAEDHALIEAGGVGYEVHCAPATLAALVPGTAATLYTELVVREDLMQLLGFSSVEERAWHRVLTSVQGVGGRVSMAILATLGPTRLARALALDDAAAVRQAPGVGPKLAQRIVRELKGKTPASVRHAPSITAPPAPTAGTAPPAPTADTTPPAPTADAAQPPPVAETAEGPGRQTAEGASGGQGAGAFGRDDADQAIAPGETVAAETLGDAVSALVNLGYDRSDALAAVHRAAEGIGRSAGLAGLIRAALRQLDTVAGER
ncbi:MAG: Holliday junction branch migration protein RuvA, partial [Pseudomonadota bacterium]